jgi:putative flavoprotein involved in K+ transport
VTGAYQRPHLPHAAAGAARCVLTSDAYRNPEQLPSGAVLVVGSGQSGRRWLTTCSGPTAGCF